jgi:hypothetical protein
MAGWRLAATERVNSGVVEWEHPARAATSARTGKYETKRSESVSKESL